jgi:hypothetical protein
LHAKVSQTKAKAYLPNNPSTQNCIKITFFSYSAQETLDSGFKCPDKSDNKDSFDISDPHPKYPDPADCAKFYICLNGVSPRAQGCELGLVFNTLSLSCDSPENVPEW